MDETAEEIEAIAYERYRLFHEACDRYREARRNYDDIVVETGSLHIHATEEEMDMMVRRLHWYAVQLADLVLKEEGSN